MMWILMYSCENIFCVGIGEKYNYDDVVIVYVNKAIKFQSSFSWFFILLTILYTWKYKLVVNRGEIFSHVSKNIKILDDFLVLLNF